MNNSNFLSKELVNTFAYTTATQDRDVCTDVSINGRRYRKYGTLQAVAFVGNLYKVGVPGEGYLKDDGPVQNRNDKYVLVIGMSKQHPYDTKVNKDLGYEIATENMWEWNKEKDEAMFAACATPEDFIAHLNAIKDDFFVGCLDIGHAEMKGLNTNSIDMIKTLDSKLAALHVHDNDKWHDSHQIPFSMNIEFKGIARALKDIDYKGYITLEADKFLIDYTEKNIVSGLLKMAESAKKFAEMICE